MQNPQAAIAGALRASRVLLSLPQPSVITLLVECHRVLVPGGVLAFSAWNHYGWYDWLKSAISRVSGAPSLPPIGEIFQVYGAWDEPSFVSQHLGDLGFRNIKVEHLDFKVQMENANTFVKGFTPMIPMALKRWGENDREQYIPLVAPELEKALAEQYGEDGAFDMRMVAVLTTASKS